jgi:hypothetical protein
MKHWGRFDSSTSVSPGKHSTVIIIIIIHYPGLVLQVTNGLSNSGLGSTPRPTNRKKKNTHTHTKKEKTQNIVNFNVNCHWYDIKLQQMPLI